MRGKRKKVKERSISKMEGDIVHGSEKLHEDQAKSDCDALTDKILANLDVPCGDIKSTWESSHMEQIIQDKDKMIKETSALFADAKIKLMAERKNHAATKYEYKQDLVNNAEEYRVLLNDKTKQDQVIKKLMTENNSLKEQKEKLLSIKLKYDEKIDVLETKLTATNESFKNVEQERDHALSGSEYSDVNQLVLEEKLVIEKAKFEAVEFNMEIEIQVLKEKRENDLKYAKEEAHKNAKAFKERKEMELKDAAIENRDNLAAYANVFSQLLAIEIQTQREDMIVDSQKDRVIIAESKLLIKNIMLNLDHDKEIKNSLKATTLKLITSNDEKNKRNTEESGTVLEQGAEAKLPYIYSKDLSILEKESKFGLKDERLAQMIQLFKEKDVLLSAMNDDQDNGAHKERAA